MPAHAVTPVILSGGSGTRLWPLSVSSRPKQFHALVGAESLFQQTVSRLRAIDGAQAPLIICNDGHAAIVAAQLGRIGQRAAIILEPAPRNTAPAVAVAALLAIEQQGDDALMLVAPSDHVITDPKGFHAAVLVATEAAQEGYLVTFGVRPDRPETGYGYIRVGAERGLWSLLDHFVEKPASETALVYVESGRYLWNSGMFLLPASLYLTELEQHAPAIAEAARLAVDEATTEGQIVRLGSAFIDCPADSIDYAVMERTDKAAVVPLAAGWSDVGSWAALREVLPRDARGNVARGDVVIENCDDCIVFAAERRVAVSGLSNAVVVATANDVLVMPLDEHQSLKTLVERIEEADSPS